MITKKTTLEQLGAIVCQSLKDIGIDCFLSGGAVVSIYTKNRYESYDLDFVSFGDRKKIRAEMEKLGFLLDRSRLFRHPNSQYMVEFPGTAVQIGDEPIREFAERKIGGKTLKLLTPTDCVKDRLAAYIHWKDRQGLLQAAMVAAEHSCKLTSVERFCRSEGKAEAFQEFLDLLKHPEPASKKSEEPSTVGSSSPKPAIHRWRLCPAGMHWVRQHPLAIPPSKSNPKGEKTTRRAHCAKNPSGKDQLYIDEIHEIDRLHFYRLKGNLGADPNHHENGDRFDPLIVGWTQYWNEVLSPDEPLDPNVVKTVIATESGFRPDALADRKRPNSARGLMQLTNESRKALGDEKGELKDHYLTLTRDDLNDPSANICAGIRWLFQKRRLASGKLGRSATWEEAVSEFKSTLKPTPSKAKRAKDLMDRYRAYFKELKK